MEITLSNPNVYFKLFYILAFLFVFAMVIVHSRKQGYKLRSVLLMLTTLSVLTVIGTRLFTIPFSEWLQVINSETTIQYGNRSAIGGLLFGFIGLVICHKVFRFKKPMLDLYAWIVPISLGIQKIGCFINGCCYGRPTELLLGVNYPQGSQSHYNQWMQDAIYMNAPFAMSIHPVQLYETLGLLTIGYVVWSTKSLWQKQASAMLFSFFLFFSFRFLMEFVRDPASSQFNENYVLGIRAFQLGIIIVGIIVGLLFVLYEKYLRVDFFKSKRGEVHFKTELLMIVSISLIIYFFNELFSQYELLAIYVKLVPATLLSLYFLFAHRSQRKVLLVGSLVLFIPILVIAQTSQKDTSPEKRYKRIDVGGSFGNFFNEVKFDPQTSDCGGTNYSREYYENSYRIGGLGFAQIIEKGDKVTTYGSNFNAGNVTSMRLATGEKQSEFVFGVNPYFKMEGKWFGYGVGVQAGRFKMNKTVTLEESELSEANKDYHVSPEFYLRFGRRDILDIDYKYGFLFPSPYPTAFSRISLGSGFGKKKDYNFRFGKIYPTESSFISAEGLINEKFGLNLMYIFKEKNELFDPSLGYDPSSKLLFGVQYRFDYKRN